MKRSLWIAAVLVLPAAATAADYHDADFHVTNITARLLYEQSGELSVDISDNPDFYSWNTIIGGGSALENADDLLVTAVVEGPGQHNLAIPLVITARADDGKVLGTRTMRNILTESTTQISLLLYEVGCAGAIHLEARLGRSVRTEEISLDCGE